MNNAIKERLQYRINKVKWNQIESIPSKFIIAGNSLNKERPKDFDLYPYPSDEGRAQFTKCFDDNKAKAIVRFKRAHTLKIEEDIIQLCNFPQDSLEELVKSFDFAHIQIGAVVEETRVQSVYYTENYAKAKIEESTFYTGTKYPISSLIRSIKYLERGDFANKVSFRKNFITILTDVVDRGFEDYGDFKDQLDAIDLAVVPEAEEFMKLFKLLTKIPLKDRQI